MAVKGLLARVRALEETRSKGSALLDWLDKAEAELPAEIEAGRLCEDLKIVYYCMRKWIVDGALR